MNLTPGQKAGKKRSKIERLLRQDHSDVYFDNERLNDALNNRIDCMQKEKLKHDIQRDLEIGKLRQEIIEAKSCQKATPESQRNNQLKPRPQTAGNFNKKRKSVISDKPRPKSAWVRSEPTETSEEPVSDYQERSSSPSSSVSTLKNNKKLRKYQTIGPKSFKENNKFPEEWYIRSIPASDAAIYNSRRTIRGKSAPPHLDYLGRLREKDQIEKKLLAYTKQSAKLMTQNNQSENIMDADGVERMSLVCQEPVKPVVMSLRRLKEISNVDNKVERGPSRNTERKQILKDQIHIEKLELEDKVKEFCKGLEELKSREARAIKEREEARKVEAQEKLYMAATDINLELTVEENSDDEEEKRWQARWGKNK